MIKLDSLTVLFVDQIIAAAVEGPVDSVTRLGAGVVVDVVGRIDTSLFEEISVVPVGLRL